MRLRFDLRKGCLCTFIFISPYYGKIYGKKIKKLQSCKIEKAYGGFMKHTLIILSILLVACTQEIPRDFTPIPSTDFSAPTSTESPASNLITQATATPEPIKFPPVAPLPPGPISMIAIGDSLTEGDGDESGRGYPGRLLALVNEIRVGSTITNFGRSGWNSSALIDGDQGLLGQLPRAVDEIAIAKSQGRGVVVLVWIGSNDLWYLYEFGGDVGDEQEVQELAHFSENIDTILSELRNAGAEVIIALLDDQSKRPIALAGQAFVEITPDELNRMAIQVVRYNEVITQKADQYGALTVDFYNTDIFTNRSTLYDDGNHPNANGYDVIAQKWFEVLLTILP
jgi:lysophospholipase L1-like esterase